MYQKDFGEPKTVEQIQQNTDNGKHKTSTIVEAHISTRKQIKQSR